MKNKKKLIFILSFIASLFFTACDNIAEYGDAPDGTPTGYVGLFEQTGAFPTLFSSNGARALQTSDARLGMTASMENDANDINDPDSQPNLNPCNTDSDDGIVSMVIYLVSIPCPAELQVLVSCPTTGTGGDYFLNVLIDLNMDGHWGGVAVNNEPEWVVQNFRVNINPGDSLIATPPRFAFSSGNRLPENAWMRIALTRENISSPDWDGTGEFSSGEIEDHVIELPDFGTNKCVPIPVVKYNFKGNVIRFPAGAPFIDFSFDVTDLKKCANAQFGWTITHLKGGDVRLIQFAPLSNPLPAPPILGPLDIGGLHPISGGGPETLNFRAFRTPNLPARYRIRVWGIDPVSIVKPTGVVIGYEDFSNEIEFVSEEDKIRNYQE